jgi:hypothetical protein
MYNLSSLGVRTTISVNQPTFHTILAHPSQQEVHLAKVCLQLFWLDPRANHNRLRDRKSRSRSLQLFCTQFSHRPLSY